MTELSKMLLTWSIGVVGSIIILKRRRRKNGTYR